MKTIICDFKRSSLGVIGEENEHNAIELLFNLPKDFEAADYIHVEFDTMDGDPFARDTFEFNKEEMTLRGRLDQKVMKAGELKIQLVGYTIDEDGTINEIAKSPVVKAIVGNSVNGIITEGDADPSMIEILKAKLDKLLEEGINVEGGGALPVAYINDKGELCFELGSGIKDARINDKGELELVIETENGDKTIILGKIKGRTPEFRLIEKILEIKYDDENTWSTLVDFSTIASSFDLRLNEETYFLEAQREVDGEWEPMVDLSALKLAHDHSNKEILDKITSSVFTDMDDAIKKKHTHDNFDVLDGITNEQINNINEIPTIKEDIEKLSSSPSSKQLVEGLLSSDENAKGLSANKKAMPTANYVWIEGNASSYLSYDSIGTAVLNVVTTTTTKSTTTTATIDVTCLSSDNALNYYNKITSNYLYMMVIFNNELSNQTPINTKINYYLKITSATISGNIVKMNFVFLDGKDTFPLTGNYSQKISIFYNYPVNGTASHAEGSGTLAVGTNSHAEGTNTIAKGITSHAEGAETVANGIFTHAEGCGTQAEGSYSHVQGKYNEIDMENKYALIVGNGTSDDNRSNAHTVDWEGNAWYAGSIRSNRDIQATNCLIPLLDDEQIALIASGSIEEGVSMTTCSFMLELDQCYLVEWDGEKYINSCCLVGDRLKLIGDNPWSEISSYNDNSQITLVNAGDRVGHTFSISKMSKPSSLAVYIDKLKSRIEALETKLASME